MTILDAQCLLQHASRTRAHNHERAVIQVDRESRAGAASPLCEHKCHHKHAKPAGILPGPHPVGLHSVSRPALQAAAPQAAPGAATVLQGGSEHPSSWGYAAALLRTRS